MPVLPGTDKIGDWNVTQLTKWVTDWMRNHPLPTVEGFQTANLQAVTSSSAPTLTDMTDSSDNVATTAFVWNLLNTMGTNVRKFGAQGDGVHDDTAAIHKAAASVAADGSGILYFPKGTYRVATAGNGVTFSSISDVAIYFEPGAKLVMDNLSGSTGTGHGIAFLNGGSNLWVINGYVVWNGTPTRSLGDGYHFICGTETGDPATTVNPMSNVNLINCFAASCPQTGAIFQGVSEPRVFNFSVKNNLADGCHFNACHRINVDGVKGYNTGDDTLAFVTYYDNANQTNHFTSGIFYRAALGDWCNTGSATNLHAESGTADGLRIGFAFDLAVSNVTIYNKQTCGIVLDAAVTGPQTWGASKGVSISNVEIEGCDTGFQCAGNVAFTDPSTFWQYDVALTNLVIRNCVNHNLFVQNSAGFLIDGVRAFGNDITVFGRDHMLDNLYCEGDNIFIGGQGTVYASLAATDKHNIMVGQVHAKGNGAGGTVQISDVGSISIETIRSTNAQNSGVQIFRPVNINVGQIHVTLPNRSNGLASSNRGLLLQKILHGDIQLVTIDHDANNLNSLEIGGGDATDIAAKDLRIHGIRYVNTINQALNINNVVLQGGATGPADFIYKIRWFNGGFATPAWSEQWFGNVTWPEQFMGSGAPAITAPVGSVYYRTDGGPGTSLYVKTSGTGSTGWTVVNTTGGGGSTQTPGAVTTVTIAHGLGVAPTRYSVQPTNANARGAPAFFLTADATNLTLNFASALTAATSYSWVWTAGI